MHEPGLAPLASDGDCVCAEWWVSEYLGKFLDGFSASELHADGVNRTASPSFWRSR